MTVPTYVHVTDTLTYHDTDEAIYAQVSASPETQGRRLVLPDRTTLGSVVAETDQTTGAFDLKLPVPDEDILWTITIKPLRPLNNGKVIAPTVVGTFSIQFSTTLRELAPTSVTAVSASDIASFRGLVDLADAARDAAEEARDDAEAARDEAVDISGISVSDDVVSALMLGTGGPKTVAALNVLERPRKPLLTHLQHGLDAIFRVLVTGTSIASFDDSSVLILPTWLQTLYGTPGIGRNLLGVLGGDYEQPQFGWKKQHYGGKQFTRLVGDNTATQLNLGVAYFDKLELECSRETDSEPVHVYVDGVQVGTTPSAGAQLYRQIVSWTGTLGTHAVTVDAPTGSGKAYLENLVTYDTSRQVGVDVIDCSLGGSGLTNMTTVFPKASGSQQIAPIAIAGNNGLDYHFARTDVDLIIVEHIVNDGGATAEFAANVDYAVEKARLLGVPIIFVIEPMLSYPTSAGYQTERTKLLSLVKHPWVTVVDWHGILWPGDDVLDNTKATLMNSLYYPSPGEVTHPDQRAYHVLTPILADLLGVPMPSSDSVSRVFNKARMVIPPALAVPGRIARINGVSQTLPAPIASAVKPVEGNQVDAVYSHVSSGATALNDPGFGNNDLILRSATSDKYGKYITTTTWGSPTTVGQLYRITVKAAYLTGGSGTIAITVPNNMRIEDEKGVQLPQTVPGNRTQVFIFPNALEGPIFYTCLARVVSGTSGTCGVSNGRLYAISMLPDSDVASTEIMTTVNDWLRVPAVETKSNPVSAVVGGAGRRYESAVTYCYEHSSLVDQQAGIIHTGQVRPLYDDPRAAQLARFDEGGGNFPTDANTHIQASGTSDAFGKYIQANFLESRVLTVTAGQELQVVMLAREIVGFQANGSNTHLVVNGVTYTANGNTCWCYTSTDDTIMPPAYFAYRVQAVASGQLSVKVRGRIYALWITDSNVPLITT